jgi:hypothetical protein
MVPRDWGKVIVAGARMGTIGSGLCPHPVHFLKDGIDSVQLSAI